MTKTDKQKVWLLRYHKYGKNRAAFKVKKLLLRDVTCFLLFFFLLCPLSFSATFVHKIVIFFFFFQMLVTVLSAVYDYRTGFDSAAIEKIAEALSTIEVIEGYLLIDFSTSFITLHMFKKLRLIKGNILWRDR